MAYLFFKMGALVDEMLINNNTTYSELLKEKQERWDVKVPSSSLDLGVIELCRDSQINTN